MPTHARPPWIAMVMVMTVTCSIMYSIVFALWIIILNIIKKSKEINKNFNLLRGQLSLLPLPSSCSLSYYTLLVLLYSITFHQLKLLSRSRILYSSLACGQCCQNVLIAMNPYSLGRPWYNYYLYMYCTTSNHQQFSTGATIHVCMSILLHSHLLAYKSHHSPKSEFKREGEGGMKNEKERERIIYDDTHGVIYEVGLCMK